ncbi:MAG: hypothetical protein ACTSYB_16550 [Candidatus Helarchaeota archaeon]
MSLDEIPDRIFVSLGRRGFDPVNPKQCPKCELFGPGGLKLLEKKLYEEVKSEEGIKRIIDYKIRCLQCNTIFYIRLQHIIQKIDGEEKRITTLVNILDEKQNDLGWVGNF